MNTSRLITKITLVLIYLVILAGAVVRMTGSGMGCPDWPKCFGYYIPPTESSDLEWKTEHSYKEGQVIIRNQQLAVASRDFTSGTTYQSDNWDSYDKHDYSTFNPWHTWIEYINRLLGALAGFSMLALFISSFRISPKRNDLRILSGVLLLGLLFQAWLGATVVYSVLDPIKISLHMFMALLLVALLMIYLVKLEYRKLFERSSNLSITLLLSLLLIILQVLLGTQVRQYVDVAIDNLGDDASLWLHPAPLLFYIHRSFSIVVVLLQVYLYRLISHQYHELIVPMRYSIAFTTIAVLSGIVMFYFDFPFSSQPIHLVIASALFGFQMYLWLRSYRVCNNSIS